ncbi:hypothetical protein HK099_002354 [Clydaea vesicula]|uniref:Methyltransferase domain-containing protein n=1 Tax=Clydaea vesicula TaxID=447962 RepID=A0AAD5XRN4_9FUNG|nr:hypothetical protein HK099_002354 [Clydaea vesicula]KAJ3376599.1 hypothetical protein HDU92_009206 [Lobulomyces angularis]
MKISNFNTILQFVLLHRIALVLSLVCFLVPSPFQLFKQKPLQKLNTSKNLQNKNKNNIDFQSKELLELAYETDTKENWIKRLDNRNRQTLKSNSVAIGSEVGPHAGDGGKWVCNPKEMLHIARSKNEKILIYSLGSNNEYSFENSLADYFGEENVDINTFDKDMYKAQPPKFVNFHQAMIVGKEQEDIPALKKSLPTLRIELGHTNKRTDIFKMDIEGFEVKVLENVVSNDFGCLLNANVLLMETHAQPTLTELNDIFYRLVDICKMELYYKEPNIQYSNGDTIEWCFVRVDWDKI